MLVEFLDSKISVRASFVPRDIRLGVWWFGTVEKIFVTVNFPFWEALFVWRRRAKLPEDFRAWT